MVSSCKKWGFAFLSCLLMLSLIVVYLFWTLTSLTLVERFAKDQVQVIEETRNRALQADVFEELKCLEYITGYYPSGTKQTTGSSLDYIVERFRKGAIKDVISDLRMKSGKDLGNKPEDWINELKREERRERRNRGRS